MQSTHGLMSSPGRRAGLMRMCDLSDHTIEADISVDHDDTNDGRMCPVLRCVYCTLPSTVHYNSIGLIHFFLGQLYRRHLLPAAAA